MANNWHTLCPPPTHTVKHQFIIAILLGLLSTTTMSCYNDVSSSDDECVDSIECVERTDGKTVCDTVNGVCVKPSNSDTGVCGNGILEVGESCDKTDLGGKTCQSWPEYVTGTLGCNQSCEFDKSGCSKCTAENLTNCNPDQICVKGNCVGSDYSVSCGDGIIDGNEECDSTNLDYKSCADFGYKSGNLKCDNCQFDKSECLECSDNTHCAGRNDGKTECRSNHCVLPGPVLGPVVVISQIYPGGGNSGATYITKYVELFNRGDADADISGWSLQYGSPDGDTIHTTQCVLPSNTKLPKGGYYLVALSSGSHGNNIKTPDFTCPVPIAPGGTRGKLFLVNNGTALSSSTPNSGYVDGVGYGDTNWSEGDNPVGELSSTTVAMRKDSGCTDTNNNGNDFEIKAPSPRSSKSPVHICETSTSTPVCGNGILESGEECDGSQYVNNKTTCQSWNSQYVSGTISCKSNCEVDLSACRTTQTPVCGNGILESGEDCDGSRYVNNKTTCQSWNSQYVSGSISCKGNCEVDLSACRTTCEEGAAECIESELSLKTCVNGRWVVESCPTDKPYCKTGAEGCSRIYNNESCNINQFVPYINDVVENGKEKKSLYACAIKSQNGSETTPHPDYNEFNSSHHIRTVTTENDEVERAKSGYGVALYFDSCNNRGETKLKKIDYYNGSSYGYAWVLYSACAQCKPNQDGELVWLFVPATYSYENGAVVCTPWE